MDSFLSRFQPDREFPDSRLVWEVEKPFLADWIAQFAPFDPDYASYKRGRRKPYHLDPACPTGRVPDPKVGIFLFEWGEDVSPIQQAGWDYLVANREAVEKSLTAKVLRIHERCLEQFAEEAEEAAFLKKHWAKIQAKLESPAAEAPGQFFKLVGISLAGSGLDGICFTGFEFQSGWDQDHGLEVVMHRERVLAAGGMTELLSPSHSIIETLRAAQLAEPDPLDFPLA